MKKTCKVGDIYFLEKSSPKSGHFLNTVEKSCKNHGSPETLGDGVWVSCGLGELKWYIKDKNINEN